MKLLKKSISMGLTNQPRDGWTDKAGCRVACTRLKMAFNDLKWLETPLESKKGDWPTDGRMKGRTKRDVGSLARQLQAHCISKAKHHHLRHSHHQDDLRLDITTFWLYQMHWPFPGEQKFWFIFKILRHESKVQQHPWTWWALLHLFGSS